jgi:glucokinase
MVKYVVVDVGGTKIKGNAITYENKYVFPDGVTFAAYSDKSKQEVLQNFLSILTALNPEGISIDGVCFAFPGPFDYERGVSLMRGIAKYESIYGLEIEKALKESSTLPWLKAAEFHFVHDIEAFAYGICSHYPAMGDKKVFCLCLGTGAGSAFLVNGDVIKGGDGIPENGWIYNEPYKDSIIDDYISARGLARLSLEVLGVGTDGLALQLMAEKGNDQAIEVFHRFGAEIGSAIQKFLDVFHPQVLVLGGNLSKGFSYFRKSLLESVNLEDREIQVEYDTSSRIFDGLVAYCKRRG